MASEESIIVMTLHIVMLWGSSIVNLILKNSNHSLTGIGRVKFVTCFLTTTTQLASVRVLCCHPV